MNISKLKPAKRQVYIMRGISGAGKSTFISGFMSQFPELKTVICSADFHFMVNGEYKFNPTQLAVAHGKCKGAFQKALAKETPVVIVDNTNLSYSEMRPYINMAQEVGYEWNIIQIETPVSLIVERQKTCKGILPEKIEKMAAKMRGAELAPEVRKRMIFISGFEGEENAQ
jgi:predicted kinase